MSTYSFYLMDLHTGEKSEEIKTEVEEAKRQKADDHVKNMAEFRNELGLAPSAMGHARIVTYDTEKGMTKQGAEIRLKLAIKNSQRIK